MRLDNLQQPLRLFLDRARVVSCREAAPVLVACTSGQVWLTVDGHPGDFFLRAGECRTIPAGRHGVIEGMETSVIELNGCVGFDETVRVFGANRKGSRMPSLSPDPSYA